MDRSRDSKGEQQFTPDQVSEIIETATRLQQLADGDSSTISVGQIGEIARELGIDEKYVAQAMQSDAQALKAANKAARRRARVYRNAGRFAVITLGLLLIDLMDGALTFWFYPGIALVMALGLQAMSAFKR